MPEGGTRYHATSGLAVHLILLVALAGSAGLAHAVPESAQGAQQQARATQTSPASSTKANGATGQSARKGAGAAGASEARKRASARGHVPKGVQHRPLRERSVRTVPRDVHHRSTPQNDASAWLGFRAGPRLQNAQQANAQPPMLPFYEARRGRTVVYVLGALHAGYPIDYPARHPFRPAILSALHDASQVAFELSPDALIDAAADVQRVGHCSSACLPRSIPPSLYRKVAARVGMDSAVLHQLSRTRPWLAAMVVESYDTVASGMETDYGTEAQIENNDLKGSIVGLETLREQLQAFDTLSLGAQQEMLEQTLAQSPQQNAADLRRVHDLWRAGDADRLFDWQQRKTAKLMRNKAMSDRIDNQIVYQRNARFVSRIEALTAPRKPVFVAVGALHLGGPKGVLSLLRAAGYQVRKL